MHTTHPKLKRTCSLALLPRPRQFYEIFLCVRPHLVNAEEERVQEERVQEALARIDSDLGSVTATV